MTNKSICSKDFWFLKRSNKEFAQSEYIIESEVKK